MATPTSNQQQPDQPVALASGQTARKSKAAENYYVDLFGQRHARGHRPSSKQPLKFNQQQRTHMKSNFTSSYLTHGDATLEREAELSHVGWQFTDSLARVQKKLFLFFYVYATLIVTLYLTYATYSYYQHQRDSAAASQQTALKSAQVVAPAGDTKLEDKINLLERHLDLLAADLEDTRQRLREREKCACSLGCLFNGTTFSDRQTWQQNCDICTCAAGRISCAPRKCPQLNDCDETLLLPGQCCPSCMKRCKYNKTIYRHGQSFKPHASEPTKECTCQNGSIKCTRGQRQWNKVAPTASGVARANSYAQLILAGQPNLAPP